MLVHISSTIFDHSRFGIYGRCSKLEKECGLCYDVGACFWWVCSLSNDLLLRIGNVWTDHCNIVWCTYPVQSLTKSQFGIYGQSSNLDGNRMLTMVWRWNIFVPWWTNFRFLYLFSKLRHVVKCCCVAYCVFMPLKLRLSSLNLEHKFITACKCPDSLCPSTFWDIWSEVAPENRMPTLLWCWDMCLMIEGTWTLDLEAPCLLLTLNHYLYRY